MTQSRILTPQFWRTTVWVLLALLPLWIGGMFGRDYWTPDEPREVDIAWNMSHQADLAVPRMAGEPFLEKPPLLYWAAAPFIAAFGPAPWATRLPNLGYAIAATVLVAMLAWQLGGQTCAWVAGLVSGSFLLALQVAVWFATDAPLVVAVALALHGLWRGLGAAPGRGKLVGYLWMSAGLGLAFFAKNVAGWMVPILCGLTFVAWEKRWRELLRWELWAAVGVLLALIIPWVMAIAAGPDGQKNLLTFFWWNLAGRFTDVGAPADIAYAKDHANSFGKYFIEAPLNLLPWSLLAIAACRRAWQQTRAEAAAPADRAAWRFAITSFGPALLLLSLSTTARGVYAAPLLPGLAVLIGLWAGQTATAADRFDRWALRGSVVLVASLALINLIALPVLLQASVIAGRSRVTLIVCTLAGLLALAWLVSKAWNAAAIHQQGRTIRLVYAAFVAWLFTTGLTCFPWIDRAQDLGSIARSIDSALGDRPLMLYQPDETTRSFVDLYMTPRANRGNRYVREPDALAQHLQTAPTTRVLVILPDYTLGPVRTALARYGMGTRRKNDPRSDMLIRELGLVLDSEHGAPDGRRYWLLKRSSEP